MSFFRRHYLPLLLFLGVALGLTLLRPSNSSSSLYQYDQGKPWQYDRLLSPLEYPILKTQQQLEEERRLVADSVPSVYRLDSLVGQRALAEWRTRYHTDLASILSPRYYSYISEQLEYLYSRGIIELENRELDRGKGYQEVSILDGYSLEYQPLTRFYTPREAYDKIMDDARGESLQDSLLNKADIASLIYSNVIPDTTIHNKLIRELQRNIPTNQGVVQPLEIIVDKGQIVDEEIYAKLRSLEYAEGKEGSNRRQLILFDIGLFSIFLLAFLIFGLYLYYYAQNVYVSAKNMIFTLSWISLFVAITELNREYQWFHHYMIPYVMLPIMMRVFFDVRTALVSFATMVILSGFFVPDPMDFYVIQLLAGMMAIIGLQSLTSRANLIRTTFLVFVVYLLSSLTLMLYHKGALPDNAWQVFPIMGINLIFLMFTYLLIYVVERIFGYVSKISLVELSDMNSKLLSDLSELAPGTFQHSMQVSILATEAARQLGADVTLVRAGALYHDIGKMKNPSYFTENQGLYNPHTVLPYEDSARIIIRHVPDGVSLAHMHNLPNEVIDFIRTHHGRGITKYFYNSYVNQNPEEEVDPAPFTYPGPNPRTREQGILMLADAVEASSRSLKEHTEEGIKSLIDKIVDSIVSEGLLNDTPLTFRDIQTIKKVFFDKIKIIYHSRISYPENKREAVHKEE